MIESSFEHWVKDKQIFMDKITNFFPRGELEDKFSYEIQELTKEQADWCELTKCKMEDLVGKELTWAEYDIYFSPFIGNCVTYYAERKSIPVESVEDYYCRFVTDYINAICSVLGIDVNDDKNKDIINKAININVKVNLLKYKFKAGQYE